MSEPLRCASCTHWLAPDRGASYAAPCALGAYPARVPFDMTCDRHSGRPQPPPVDMQSQTRGVLYQMWGVKP